MYTMGLLVLIIFFHVLLYAKYYQAQFFKLFFYFSIFLVLFFFFPIFLTLFVWVISSILVLLGFSLYFPESQITHFFWFLKEKGFFNLFFNFYYFYFYVLRMKAFYLSVSTILFGTLIYFLIVRYVSF
jgi:hypothetical protein